MTASMTDTLQVRRMSKLQHDEANSISSHVSKDEKALKDSAIGERLPYNDYTTIDWLHDLVKDSYRYRSLREAPGLRRKAYAVLDDCSGWIAIAACGILTACIAFCVDVAVVTVSDWKLGYCKENIFKNRSTCLSWHQWSNGYWKAFGVYLGFALCFGICAAGLTMTTKRNLPAAAPGYGDNYVQREPSMGSPLGKSMYMAAGSGIPEIKTLLSGFEIPDLLSLKTLIVKAVGATFAVPTSMCLGKEGPFCHISASVTHLVTSQLPRFKDNGRKSREILAAGVAAGLTVAFGTAIGGVLFAYEEIATYFPRKILWRAFLCSALAAYTLQALNPTGTGKLILFETHYNTSYQVQHYAIFILIGVAGGLWGGTFCKLNSMWSRWFRSHRLIKNHPVFEVFLIVLATVLLQYPNPLTRQDGDVIIRNLLVDCRDGASASTWVCINETREDGLWGYVGWLAYGCIVKLVLTTVTFGAKVPSGILIPSMDAGSLFGRLVGLGIGNSSPGVFAMVGSGAFLAGVSRMTVSLCVILVELTGELEFILPHMFAILTAKWVADAISREGVYDIAQSVLGHPFLDLDHSMQLVRSQSPAHQVRELVPPKSTMDEITVRVEEDGKIASSVLHKKLNQLQDRGLMDAGLVLVQNDTLQGYLAQGELEFALPSISSDSRVRLLGEKTAGPDDFLDHYDEEQQPRLDRNGDGDIELITFVDRTPLTICEAAPMEYAVEMFGKLGLRHLLVTEEGGKLKGVVIKKRFLSYLESLH